MSGFVLCLQSITDLQRHMTVKPTTEPVCYESLIDLGRAR